MHRRRYDNYDDYWLVMYESQKNCIILTVGLLRERWKDWMIIITIMVYYLGLI